MTEELDSGREKHAHVLIVDDDEDLRTILFDGLTHIRCTASVAVDGATALALAAASPPDIALLDIGLPDIPGTELAARLKDLCPEAVIIFITAYDSTELAVELIHAGAFYYLVKPFSLDKVWAVVAEAWATHPARAKVSLCLTQREREIVALLAEGKSNRQIAEELGLTEQSVKNRLRDIFPKLGARTRAQAIVRAIELKLTKKG